MLWDGIVLGLRQILSSFLNKDIQFSIMKFYINLFSTLPKNIKCCQSHEQNLNFFD